MNYGITLLTPISKSKLKLKFNNMRVKHYSFLVILYCTVYIYIYIIEVFIEYKLDIQLLNIKLNFDLNDYIKKNNFDT